MFAVPLAVALAVGTPASPALLAAAAKPKSKTKPNASQAQQPASAKAFPFKTESHTLPNGLRVVLIPYDSPGLVAYWTFMRVGRASATTVPFVWGTWTTANRTVNGQTALLPTPGTGVFQRENTNVGLAAVTDSTVASAGSADSACRVSSCAGASRFISGRMPITVARISAAAAPSHTGQLARAGIVNRRPLGSAAAAA